MTKVLLVEDEADLLALVSETLDHHGLAVTEARNGQVALDRLREGGDYDVVVSDIAMPGKISGIDVAQEVFTHHPGVRVILTSGHPLSNFPPLPPSTMFLSKPYRVKQLVEMLNTAN